MTRQDNASPSADAIALVGEVSRQIGYEAAMIAIRTAGEDTLQAARSFWQHPRHTEVLSRREVDHQPCASKCRRCSKCIHSMAWYSRGKRDFLGIEQEKALAEQVQP